MTYFRVLSRTCILRSFWAAVCFLFLSLPASAEIGAHILIDAETGEVLEQSQATRLWYPASLTKIMTAYVTFKAIREERISLTSPVVQSANSLSEPPSKMGFKVGTQLTVENALKIILIKSANDVSVALAEAVGGSEEAFISMMNAQAQQLGMANTRFFNPHGLPDNGQVTTARDLAILARAFWKDFPEARSFYNQAGIQFGKKVLRSANREFLFRVQGANGMKTGYICNSGYNVAATATRRGRTLIAVVLGAGSGLERIAFSRELMNKGFKKGGSRTRLSDLRGTSGSPPADGYCKRNKKPDVETIMARFDLKPKKKSFFSAFAPTQEQGSVLRQGTAALNGATTTDDGITLPNGKTDWLAVLDRTIGPKLRDYAPIVVAVGVPGGSANVARVPFEVVPLPVAKPKIGQNAAVQEPVTNQAATEAAASATDSPAYGSLFRKGKGFTIPIPSPSPR